MPLYHVCVTTQVEAWLLRLGRLDPSGQAWAVTAIDLLREDGPPTDGRVFITTDDRCRETPRTFGRRITIWYSLPPTQTKIEVRRCRIRGSRRDPNCLLIYRLIPRRPPPERQRRARVATVLTRYATSLLPAEDRAEYGEIFLAELAELSYAGNGQWVQAQYALRVLIRAPLLCRELRKPTGQSQPERTW